MVTTSGFTHTPLSRLVILSIISSSLLTSILDIKHLLPIDPTPHLWPYLQFSRLLTFQLAYISSTELLFAVSLLYQFRVLERIWGSRKFGSFVVVAWALVGAGVSVLGVLLDVITWGHYGYIAPGLTGVVFATLAMWRGQVPRLYGVKIITGLENLGRAGTENHEGAGIEHTHRRHGPQVGEEAPASPTRTRAGTGAITTELSGVILSDKFTTYVLAAQLALSQFPYQLLPAAVGWIVGAAWREELLPMGMIRWRIPGWVVGDVGPGKRSRGQYEGLRRRLEEEGGAQDGMREVSESLARGENPQTTQDPNERRGLVRTLLGYFNTS